MLRTLRRLRRAAAAGFRLGDLVLCGLRYRMDLRFGRLNRPAYDADYGRLFPLSRRVFQGYLRRWRALPAANGHRSPVAVVVTPWVETPVPWYSVMLAIGLARLGRKVVIVWDDTGFPQGQLATQNRAIGRVLSYVGRVLPVVQVSTQPPVAMGESDVAPVDKLARLNLTWTLRGARPSLESEPLLRELRHSLAVSLPRIRGALGNLDVEVIVVPGGVFGTSGLFRLVGAEQGRRVATFDGPKAFARVCVDGVAAQASDLPMAFASLLDSDEETLRSARELAQKEFEVRESGLDHRATQVVASESRTNSDDFVLMPLNIEWDTAALGQHLFFADTADWITSTVEEVLRLDTVPVLVRQHPAERTKNGQLDVESILRERFGDDPRVRFVAAHDPVSTYDLIRSARLVLPFVSTIGIEAAAMGRTVVVSGNAFYADLGFVWAPKSRDEYIDLVRRGARGALPSLPDQVDRAWLCYYLSTVCTPVPTHFTAQPSDFPKWVRHSPEELFSDPAVSDLLVALDQAIPLSLLRHERFAASTGPRRPVHSS